MTDSIPLFNIDWDEGDVESVSATIRRGKNWANGPEIQQFEDNLSEYFNTRYSLTFNNGTSALHAVFLAAGIKPSDEIIVPSFTFISTVNSCLFVGAKPVFADIEPRFFGLDPEEVKSKITKKTKAIVPIHYGGCPCAIRELKDIAEDNKILLIEDNAESFGAKINNKFAGTFGDASILSFCQNKIITTGEGGAILTESKEIFERLKLIRSHGRLEENDYFSSSDSFDYITLGYNFRLPSMNAALGISQLKKVNRIISQRREIAKKYIQHLSRYQKITIPSFPADYYAVYQMFPILVDESIRSDLMEHLTKHGIASKVYFDPVHLTSFYRNTFNYKNGYLKITESISKRVISLPIFPTMTDEQINYVCTSIHDYLVNSNA